MNFPHTRKAKAVKLPSAKESAAASKANAEAVAQRMAARSERLNRPRVEEPPAPPAPVSRRR